MLEIRDMVCTYGQISALKGISLSVKAGQLVALIGANGAGKSTTLRAISGLVPARSGRMMFEGEDITGMGAQRVLTKGIAHCPEGRRVFPHMTVAENLDMGAYLRKDAGEVAADRERIYTEFSRLAERRKQAAGTLSGGEQQMLAVGRALVLNPKVLLLDEPTEGLAPIIVDELLAAIGKISRTGGICSIIVEQNARKILGLADRVVILERGTIVHDAASEALKADPGVLDHFLGVAGVAGHNKHQAGPSGASIN